MYLSVRSEVSIRCLLPSLAPFRRHGYLPSSTATGTKGQLHGGWSQETPPGDTS